MKIKKAVIPAAGLGTRMLPATKTMPKEMLPIAGKPSIQYIVEEAVEAGIEDVLIITSRGKTTIEDYFDYAPELYDYLMVHDRKEEARSIHAYAEIANIYYARQKLALGLGHAILCAKNFVGDEPFAVLLGDDIMLSDKQAVTKQLSCRFEDRDAAVVGIRKVPDSLLSQYCSLNVSNIERNFYRVHDMIEKPRPQEFFSNYAILGRYILPSKIFSVLENIPTGYGGELQLTDAIAVLCHESPGVYGVDFEGARFDTGNPVGYLEANLEFSLQNREIAPWLREYIRKKAADFETPEK